MPPHYSTMLCSQEQVKRNERNDLSLDSHFLPLRRSLLIASTSLLQITARTKHSCAYSMYVSTVAAGFAVITYRTTISPRAKFRSLLGIASSSTFTLKLGRHLHFGGGANRDFFIAQKCHSFAGAANMDNTTSGPRQLGDRRREKFESGICIQLSNNRSLN